ncbi:hypothetical protein EVAR_42042_1 [Eumeta japonica]|uniref:Uncharacterized protein n=1 Tax=Eumeta variegata TaxID=151549 RepID=A0A4C1YAM8_EUMVA|nr:hypothetical protein EVAR_42042_1 [Eumeta japonica]
MITRPRRESSRAVAVGCGRARPRRCLERESIGVIYGRAFATNPLKIVDAICQFRIELIIFGPTTLMMMKKRRRPRDTLVILMMAPGGICSAARLNIFIAGRK